MLKGLDDTLLLLCTVCRLTLQVGVLDATVTVWCLMMLKLHPCVA